MSDFERREEIERHKTIERPFKDFVDIPKPGYIPVPKLVTLTDVLEAETTKPKRKYTKKAK